MVFQIFLGFTYVNIDTYALSLTSITRRYVPDQIKVQVYMF